MIRKMLQSIFNYVSERIFMKIASRLNKRPEQAQEKLKKFFLGKFPLLKIQLQCKVTPLFRSTKLPARSNV